MGLAHWAFGWVLSYLHHMPIRHCILLSSLFSSSSHYSVLFVWIKITSCWQHRDTNLIVDYLIVTSIPKVYSRTKINVRANKQSLNIYSYTLLDSCWHDRYAAPSYQSTWYNISKTRRVTTCVSSFPEDNNGDFWQSTGQSETTTLGIAI